MKRILCSLCRHPAVRQRPRRCFGVRCPSEPVAVMHKGPGKAPAPVLRDVLLLRRLAPARATGRHLPLSCPPPP